MTKVQDSDSLESYQWLDFIAIAVIATSISSLLLLVLGVFSPKHALLLGVALAIAVFYFTKSLVVSAKKHGRTMLLPLMAVIMFAAFFRVEPYPWINGGQDQGVYVSMSAYFQRGGEIFVRDSVLDQIADPDLQEVYKSNRVKSGFHPGVYYGGERDYVFQFYHLHPLWMSIFADLFGDNNRGYALTFFGLLSIVFLSLLSYELSQSRLVALSVALLLATNPLHAFFSKWPVTEIVALAFSSMAFYYLSRAYRAAEQGGEYRNFLVISAAALGMLFFVRISGFLYLPSLALLFMTGAWLRHKDEGKFGVDLVFYAVTCMILYLFSVRYGLVFSPNYSVAIYQNTFGKIAGVHWSWMMGGLFSIMLLGMALWVVLLRQKSAVERIELFIRPMLITRVMLIFTFCALILSLYKVYLLGYTDVLANDPWLGKRWSLSGAGLEVVWRSSVLNWLAYSSPLLIGLGLWALFRRNVGHRVWLILVVALISLCGVAITNPVFPYQYYYARYLLTEAVPYVLVVFTVVTVGCRERRWRNAGLAVVLASAAWFSFFTISQLPAEEGVTPRESLREIATRVGEGDVLLIEPSGWSISRFTVETPLRFYFGLNTFALSADDRETYLHVISDSFRRVWLLSPKPIDDEHYNLHLRVRHQDKVMERVGHIPLSVVEGFWNQELYLYELKKRGWPSSGPLRLEARAAEYLVSPDSPEVSLLLGEGWHEIEAEHVWSSSEAELFLDAHYFSSGMLPQVVVLELAAYGASLERPVSVRTKVCDGLPEQAIATSGRFELRIEIPENRRVGRCTINLNVDPIVSPKALGRSGDDRELGVALYQFSFE